MLTRTRTLLIALAAATILAGPAWASAAPTTPTCTGYTPTSVTVGLNPKTVKFSACATHWTLLQENGLFSADWRTPKNTFGNWLENSDAGLSSVSISQTETGIFQLRRATRFHGGKLQAADWNTETWVPLAGVTVRLFVGAEAVETATTDKTGGFAEADRIEHAEYLGSVTLAPATDQS